MIVSAIALLLTKYPWTILIGHHITTTTSLPTLPSVLSHSYARLRRSGDGVDQPRHGSILITYIFQDTLNEKQNAEQKTQKTQYKTIRVE